MHALPDRPRVHVAVVGMAGVGKSALLNALVNPEGDSEPFVTGASATSCTQKVVTKEFEVKTGEGDGSCTWVLTDTMGFPDTDPERIVAYYDEVVRACRAPLNAVVWVVKFERTVDEVYKKQAVLTREFRLHLEVPIILVINNHQKLGPRNMTKAASDKKKKAVEKDMVEFKEKFLKETGLNISHCVSAPEMEDLNKVAELLPTISSTEPKCSPKLRTFADLQALYTTAVTSKDAARRACAEQEQHIKRAEEQVQYFKAWLGILRGRRWSHIFLVSAPVLEWHIGDCRVSLARAEVAHEAAIKELALMRANRELAEGKWAQAQDEFRTLCDSLLGQELAKSFQK